MNFSRNGSRFQLIVQRFPVGSSNGRQFSTNDIPQMTGTFRKNIPDVYPPSTHYRRALKTLHSVKIDENIKNIGSRRRKYTCQVIDKLMVGLTSPLTEILKAFKQCMGNLHPYELVVTTLTLNTREKAGLVPLQDVLADVQQLRAETSRIAKHYAAEAKTTRNSTQATEVLQNAKIALQRLYNVESKVDIKKTSNSGLLANIQIEKESYHHSNCLIELSKILKDLRKLPVVELTSPSVVLVGSPNVGKSSLVRAISSGVPEVADYAFTTRSVSIGHIETDGHHIQVIDTPGLLDRPASERNDMENLTFSSMAHIPSVVLFVIDPTGLSGPKSTLSMQLNIRNKLRKEFPIRPWIDVITKRDVGCDDDVLALLPAGALFVSPKNGEGMDELHVLVHEKIMELSGLLEARAREGEVTETAMA